jgi:hypothetical protein
MKAIYFIWFICAWSIGVHAQIITTPHGYDIRTVSINNTCEEALYAELASKAAASINDDNSLKLQLSRCAVHGGERNLVYKGITYENPLPQPYANTYWRRRSECDKSTQSGTDSGNTSESDDNSGNNDYGSSDNGMSQNDFANIQRKNVEMNDIIFNTTEMAINNLNVSRDKIQDDLNNSRDNKISLADKYQKKGGADNSQFPLEQRVANNGTQNGGTRDFQTFKEKFFWNASFTKDDSITIENKANSMNLNTLNELVKGIDFQNWKDRDKDGKKAMLEKLAINYLSQCRINDFIVFDASYLKFNGSSLALVPPINPKPITEGSVAKCWPPAYIKNTTKLKALIEIHVDVLQSRTAYEAIASTLHEAHHAYQYYHIEEYQKSEKKYNQSEKATIEKWHNEIKEYNKISEEIENLDTKANLLSTTSNQRVEIKKELDEKILERKQLYDIMVVEKDANETAAIITLALQRKIYKWE